MALVAARGFSGGPMSDIDYGMVSSPMAWVESVNDLLVTQPNTGTRTVSIAAGWHSGWGLRQQNDAAIPQALGAPSSGGAWYLLVVRRDWGAKNCTLQVLAGPTTGTTTTPTATPADLPATFAGTPGTSADYALAWAFVNSANTTVTLFDMRLIRTGGGPLMVPNIAAANGAAATGYLREGGKLHIGSHNLLSDTGYGITGATLEVRQDGRLRIAKGSSVGAYGESGPLGARGVRALAAAFGNYVGAYPRFALEEGDIVRSPSGDARYTTNNGNRWLLWNVYNLPVQSFITLGQDVVYDDNGGLSSADVIGGVLHLCLSLYATNVRASGDGWAQIPVLRPRLRVIATGRAYSGADNGAEGIATLSVVSDGTISLHRFASPGPQRANAWSGTIVYPIDQ